MVESSEALTLRTYDFGEANKIVVFLTKHAGLLRGVAYGAKKSRSRFGSSLEQFTHVRTTYKRKENEDLVVFQNCEIIRPSPAYRLGFEENLHCSYFAELVVEFVREEVESEKLFRLTNAVLDAMGTAPTELLARYFELWLLRLEGVLPALNTVLSDELAGKAIGMLKLPPSEMAKVTMSDRENAQLASATEKLIEYQLEKPLKAKRMLKELL
jgi:DNA repair protein RecO (recombination protein O)